MAKRDPVQVPNSTKIPSSFCEFYSRGPSSFEPNLRFAPCQMSEREIRKSQIWFLHGAPPSDRKARPKKRREKNLFLSLKFFFVLWNWKTEWRIRVLFRKKKKKISKIATARILHPTPWYRNAAKPSCACCLFPTNSEKFRSGFIGMFDFPKVKPRRNRKAVDRLDRTQVCASSFFVRNFQK